MDTLLLDKSAFQALPTSELASLSKDRQLLMVDVLGLELLGNAAKYGQKKTQALSRKFLAADFVVNMPVMEICAAELLGHEVVMDQKPLVYAQEISSRGSLGYLVEETALEVDIRRWARGDFTEEELALSGVWCESIRNFDLGFFERSIRAAAHTVPHKPQSMSEVATIVDGLLRDETAREGVLGSLLAFLKRGSAEDEQIIARWTEDERPSLLSFSPFCVHFLRCLFTLFIGVGFQLIGHRNSNFVDTLYLGYLPFCTSFCSDDNLHRQLFEHIGWKHEFLSVDDLKKQMG